MTTQSPSVSGARLHWRAVANAHSLFASPHRRRAPHRRAAPPRQRISHSSTPRRVDRPRYTLSCAHRSARRPYLRDRLFPHAVPIVPGHTQECSAATRNAATRRRRARELADPHLGSTPPHLIMRTAATNALQFPPTGFISFNSAFAVVFSFPSQYLFAIGLAAVFSFTRFVPRALLCILKHSDSTSAGSFEPTARTAIVRGYHTLWRAFPGHLCCAAGEPTLQSQRSKPYNAARHQTRRFSG